eukprot:1382945-Amorphochlora_amoeboformis.AAC.1
MSMMKGNSQAVHSGISRNALTSERTGISGKFWKRDVTSRCVTVHLEARYYRILPGTARYYPQGNLRATSGISSYLQLSVDT